MCQSFIGESELWLTAGLQQVPLTVLTGEDKQTLAGMVGSREEFRRGSLMQEFDILAKRARSSAVRSK